MKKLSLFLAFILLAFFVYQYKHDSKPVVQSKSAVAPHVRPAVLGTQEVCSFNAPPCIHLALPDGGYDLNDFRLYHRNCISFVSLPDHVQRSYCGKFTLQWIGPENQ